MPSINISSEDFDKLGINLKDILNAIANKKDDMIVVKKKKRKNKKKKKKGTSQNPLQNNKPNFTSNNQMAGSGGGVQSSYNPLYQRPPPAVTTVVNTPNVPNVPNNNGIEKLLLQDKKFENISDEIHNGFDDLGVGLNQAVKSLSYGINAIDKGIKNYDIKYLQNKPQHEDSDGIGFQKQSYNNPLSDNAYISDANSILSGVRSLNRRSENLLSNIESQNLRSIPQSQSDIDDRFGIMPINSDFNNEISTIYNDESNITDNNIINTQTFDFDNPEGEQKEDYMSEEIQKIPQLPQLPDYDELNKAYEQLGGKFNKFDNETEDMKKKYYGISDSDVSLDSDVWRESVKNYKNKQEKKSQQKETNLMQNEDARSNIMRQDDLDEMKQREYDRIRTEQLRNDEQARRQEKEQKKIDEYQRKIAEGKKPRGRPVKGATLTREEIQSQPKFSNDNSKLTSNLPNNNSLLDEMNQIYKQNNPLLETNLNETINEPNVTKRSKGKSKMTPVLDPFAE